MQPDGQASSAAEFAAFVATRQRQLQRAAWLLTGDWAAAEDLVQSALAKTWRHWRRVRSAEDPDAYVRRIIVNLFANGWRRRWRGEVATDALPETEMPDVADDLSVRLSVQAALQHLSRRQRAVVVLRYFDDLTEAQTANVLGCAVGTVKSTTGRALERLRAEPILNELLVEK